MKNKVLVIVGLVLKILLNFYNCIVFDQIFKLIDEDLNVDFNKGWMFVERIKEFCQVILSYRFEVIL